MRMQIISWHTCDHTINGYHWVRVACHLRLSCTLKNLLLFKIDTWNFQTQYQMFGLYLHALLKILENVNFSFKGAIKVSLWFHFTKILQVFQSKLYSYEKLYQNLCTVFIFWKFPRTLRAVFHCSFWSNSFNVAGYKWFARILFHTVLWPFQHDSKTDLFGCVPSSHCALRHLVLDSILPCASLRFPAAKTKPKIQKC